MTDVRPPRQARSQATWTRVLDVGVDILEQDGHEALTIANLCERASVTPPTVYARAPDKQALMLAIHDHAVKRLEERLVLSSGSSPASAVASIAEPFLRDAALVRAIIRQAGSEPGVFASGSASVVSLGVRFAAAVGRDAIRADACFRIVIGALAHRVVDGPNFASDRDQSDEDFLASLCEIAGLYLANES